MTRYTLKPSINIVSGVYNYVHKASDVLVVDWIGEIKIQNLRLNHITPPTMSNIPTIGANRNTRSVPAKTPGHSLSNHFNSRIIYTQFAKCVVRIVRGVCLSAVNSVE